MKSLPQNCASSQRTTDTGSTTADITLLQMVSKSTTQLNYCTKKPTCPHCGRAGHDADVCGSAKRNAKVGDRAVSVTRANQDLLVQVQDEKNAAETYDMISKYTANRDAAAATAYQSAAVHRQTKDAARRAASSVNGPWKRHLRPRPQHLRLNLPQVHQHSTSIALPSIFRRKTKSSVV
eukprot:Blabericola_migrator_1__5452@NODE_2789_length_2350_cov_110_777486_g1748_i0_p2_GENE_NODE_2789_length_2350_cov_110_777486_g1748_i0NODE_2789_length_2350_cov_110_777486_g1748_i0_p2_ORF_typecomplete_len179_score9_37zfCCHC_4/PF14392_6/0_19_NODE_2789_length_2350_cov_110_777486_g1748_i014752011